MIEINSNPKYDSSPFPQDWPIDELEARAGALVNQALENWSYSVKRAHWEDMKQTAMMAFLEHQEKLAAYGYTVARNALKTYKWVHIRGLSGGWDSLAAREYTVSDSPLEVDGDGFDSPRDNLHWRLPKERGWDPVPRPVEWAVLDRLSEGGPTTTEELFRETLYILAGMSKSHWYPEQIYRAALIIAMLVNGYIWEDVAARTDLDVSEVDHIWWHHRKTRLSPYINLPPLHQEIIKMRGQVRLAYFEELSTYWLNQPRRKMVVFGHGIYTVTYKRRGRKPGEVVGRLEGSLQKGRQVDGRLVVRAVSLGQVGEISKEHLLVSSHRLERKLDGMGDDPISLGRISQSRQALFASVPA